MSLSAVSTRYSTPLLWLMEAVEISTQYTTAVHDGVVVDGHSTPVSDGGCSHIRSLQHCNACSTEVQQEDRKAGQVTAA